MEERPFAGLSPDCVLGAIESLGLRVDGRLLALNSYENRVYQVGIEGGEPVVAKFYRPARWSNAAIEEEHAFVAELAELEIPAVPALVTDHRTLHEFDTFRFAVFPRRGGRAPELDRPETLEWLGRLMGRLHGVGQRIPFVQRPALDFNTFGVAPLQSLLARRALPADLEGTYEALARTAIDAVRARFSEIDNLRVLRLHGDCHAGNVLWTDLGPHFVDFDDARSGPAVQDLWMLVSGDRDEIDQRMECLLAGYEQFCVFDRREFRLIEPLRTLRLIHYAAWLAERWDDPAFPPAFPWFNTHAYWRERIEELQGQIVAMEQKSFQED